MSTIEIKTDMNEEVTLHIYDLFGRPVKSFIIAPEENITELLLRDLLSGTYFLSLSSMSIKESFKFIKL